MTEKQEKFGDYIAEVKGIGNNVTFKLREKEIKHIRRCIRAYSLSHERDYPNVKKIKWDDLSSRIYIKFLKFGKLKKGIKGDKKRAMLKDLKRKCSQEGCEERDNLTIAHIIPRSSGVDKDTKENIRLMCQKHHLLYDLKSILWKKGLEIEKIKNRIKEIEEKNTTDALGMGVLSENKFTDPDAEELLN